MSLRSLVLALVLVTIPTAASAQESRGDPAPDPHVGLFGGFSLQAGNVSCSGDDCNKFYKAGGFDGHVGWGFNKSLGLVFDLYVLTAQEGDLSITQGLGTIGVRYWIVPILWVQAGVGGAEASYKYTGIPGFTIADHTENAAGFTAAAGFEVLKAKRFALDVEARFGYGVYGDNNNDGHPDNTGRSTSLGVGFTWF
jgi:hypothetical protein